MTMTHDQATYESYYAPTLKRMQALERTAGQMLAGSYDETRDTATCRQIAEESAREAAALAPGLKAWRLANGYDG